MLSANHLLILRHIHQQPEIARTSLSELTHLSQATVLRLVSDLLAMGYVVQQRSKNSQDGPGRPSMTLIINPELGYVVGLEFGQEHLVACITDATGECVYSHQFDVAPPFKPKDATFDRLAVLIRQVVDDAGLCWSKVKAVGLAPHGVVSADGHWLIGRHSESRYPARQWLTDRLERLVYLEDVSRAFAVAEHRIGAGMNVPDMIYVFVGSHGIGAGIFVNDVLLKSTSGVCGELGHIIVEADGALCQCGNRGCLETVATHEAVVQRLRNRLQKGVISSLRNDDTLTFAQICQAANAGDKEAHIAIEKLATYLAQALAGTINTVGATLIIIGGQLRLAGSGFLSDLESKLRRQVLPVLAKQLNVQYAALPAYAGAWGVASQASEAAWAADVFTESHHPTAKEH